MVTDAQVRLLRKKMAEGKTIPVAAAAAGMSERSGHTWKAGPSADGRTWAPALRSTVVSTTRHAPAAASSAEGDGGAAGADRAAGRTLGGADGAAARVHDSAADERSSTSHGGRATGERGTRGMLPARIQRRHPESVRGSRRSGPVRGIPVQAEP